MKKKLKLLLTKEEGKISKLALGIGSALFFSITPSLSEIIVKAGHLHQIISENQACVISTQAGFDYGGIDWSDVNWFNNVNLKCNMAKKWHNIISYGCCCGYTFTWNDIETP
ncbi:MAG: hypothetical protein ABGW69_01045 [Nanoarchaeota archaeon]